MLIGGTELRDNNAVETPRVDRFEPESNTWQSLPPMSDARQAHLGVVDPRGDAIVMTGLKNADPDVQLTSTEIFSATERTWSAAASASAPHALGTATVLADGRVLVTGGYEAGTQRGGDASAVVEIYDPVGDRWIAGEALPQPRIGHTAVRLRDNRVVIVGGNVRGVLVAGELRRETFIYDLASDSWAPGATLANGRWRPALSLLEDGTLMVVGGLSNDGGEPAELLDASATASIRLEAQPPATERQSTVELQGFILLFGNASSDRLLVASAFRPEFGWQNLQRLPVERDDSQAIDAVRLADDLVLVSGANAISADEGYLPSVAAYGFELPR